MPLRVLLLLWLCVSALAVPAGANKADDTLRVVWGADGPLDSADFYFSTKRTGREIAALIWDTLVWRDPTDFSYQPLLAKAWRQIDATTLEFDLRDDVWFQDGSKFTAADVVGTVNTVAVPDFKVPVQRNVNWIAAAVQTGIYGVRIISKLPFPPALDYIANTLPIYPAEHYAAVGPERMGAHPIGTGPYRMVSMEIGKAYRMVRNDNYFKGSPKGDHFIKTIDIREVADGQMRVAELLAHRADMTWGISTDQLQQIAGRKGFAVVRAETMRVAYLGLDAARRSGTPALQNVDVRRAIAYAVNRQSIMQNLMGGPARVLDAPCYPKMFGCISEAAHHYDYAPDMARDLLRASGYGDKVAFDFYVDPMLQAAGEAVVADLAKVGITARLRISERSALREAQINDRTPMVLLSCDAHSVNDVSEMIGQFFEAGKEDYARDPELHGWLGAADETTDAAKQKELYAKAIERITDQVDWLPLFTFVQNYAFTDQVAFTPSADELVRLYRVHWN
ncbi:MAG TPA: ABC transporter substrate-binding protein [Acetobacteraceae bacterium]|nr:ABC transporter substrate-binding protein [Acetobacteraceae bacterium]